MVNKPTYKELEQRVKELETIFDLVPDLIGSGNLEGYFTKINSSFRKILGYSEKELYENPFLQFIHDDDVERTKDALAEAIKGRREIYLENRYKCKDGSYKWIEWFVLAVANEDRFFAAGRNITERKQAEKAHRKSEEKFRILVETSSDWIWEVTEEGVYTYASPQVESILGFRPEEVIGKTPFDFMSPEESTQIEKIFKDLTEKGKPIVALENINLHKDGSRIVLETSGVPVLDEDGKMIGYRGIDRDITTRKLAEEELKQSEDKLNRLFNFADYMVCIADLEKQYFTKISPAFTRHLGWSEKELLSQPILDFIHPDDIAKTAHIINEQMEKGVEVIQFENRYRTKNGGYRWFEWAANPVPAEGITYSAAYDITERKQAEAAALESAEFREKILLESPVGITIYDIESGQCVAANRSMEEFVGGSQEQLLAQNFYHIESWKKSGLLEAAQSAIKYDSKSQCEVNLTTTFGKSAVFEGFFAPFLVGGKKYLQLTISDKTEQRQLEEQLRQSQKMESIGTLAGGIAHDFNNILGIIVGNTELAINDVPEWNPARYNLEEVRKASLRARDMVKQILSFSRQTKQEAKPVRIRPIIEETLKLVRSSIPTSIEIRQNYSAQVDTILADPTQINQIIMNLCTNANHAMQEDGGILEVGLKNMDLDEKDVALYHDLPPGEYIALEVSDSGHGMESDVADRIFDPYFTTKEVGDGTGMGLAVVHGIVKNHNGAVHVYSEPGKGTTFKVFFPLIESEEMPESTSHEPLPTGTERILFVDDEDALADLGKRMLERLGYNVTVRTSSIEALEAFKSQPDKFDLVLTDMTMPNMTGNKLAEEVMKIRHGFPIILCTGYSEMVTEANAQQFGIKAFVMKPLVMREIAETIRQVLAPKKE